MAVARAQGTVVLLFFGVVDASGAKWLEHLLVDLIDGRSNHSIAMDLFMAHLLDPDEFELVDKAMKTAHVFADLRKGGVGGAVSALANGVASLRG